MTKKQKTFGLTVLLAVVLGAMLNQISNDTTVAVMGVVGVMVIGVILNWYINKK